MNPKDEEKEVGLILENGQKALCDKCDNPASSCIGSNQCYHYYCNKCSPCSNSENKADISSIYAFDSAKDFDIFFHALCDRFGVDPDDEFFKKKKDD